MGTFSIWHWIIVLVVVLLVFGTKRLRGAGRDLGEAIKGMSDADEDKPAGRLEDQQREADPQRDAKQNEDARR